MNHYAYRYLPNLRTLAPLTRDDVEALYGPEAVRQIDEHESRPWWEVAGAKGRRLSDRRLS